MTRFLAELYPGPRFLYGLAVIILCLIALFVLGMPGWTGLAAISSGLAYIVWEVYILFGSQSGIKGKRTVAGRLSNGDENPVIISMQSDYSRNVEVVVIDELPFEFQLRHHMYEGTMPKEGSLEWLYHLRPVRRGIYEFGNTLVFVRVGIGIWERRFNWHNKQSVAVYPSFLQLTKYELIAFGQQLSEKGRRKIPRRGVGLEFDQITKYNSGDDMRQINWRSTAKHGELMVNRFTEEKSQSIYQCIDKGRLMHFPFDGMYLLDYAINASLMLSNIILKKGDKSGLICFDNEVSGFVAANKSRSTLHHVLEQLYHVKPDLKNADHEKLSHWMLSRINQRSILFMYTHFVNFEAFKRKEKYLHAIANRHLLIVIMFKNTGVDELLERQPKNMREVYEQVLAEQQWIEQLHIQKRLRWMGIECILTTPHNLSPDTLNKYLELKAMGKV